ncbi:MAG: retropepsin-like aspartic protease [Salibacteraceae bacterium]
MKSLIISAIIFVLIGSMGCSSTKVYKLMGGGEIAEPNYKVVIPFEMRLGLIILKVNIKGEEYDFLYDTGAPNVVCLELGKKLNLKAAGKSKTRDSQGERHRVDYANIDTITIGGLNYLNTTAAIMDLKKAVVLDCMEFDGILGANVMRNSVWQIDYQKQEIIITNSTDSLLFTSNLDTIPFTVKHTGTPIIDVKIGNIIQKRVTLDTGSGGNIDLNYETYKNARKRQPNMPITSGYGHSSSGIYGMGVPDTLFYFKPDSITIGSVQLENKIITASKGNTSSTLGTRFFEHYVITLDWGRNQIVLDSVSEYQNSEVKSYGYKPQFENNQLRVGFLFTESTTGSQNMSLYDQIIQIDSNDYSNITRSEYCELILDTNKSDLEEKLYKIIHKDSVRSIILKKEVMLK